MAQARGQATGFEISTFTPTRMLGEGVWGRVYDLGDGTVLKIARETCAGIGSGGAKIDNECAALTLLARAGKLSGLIPAVIARGEIPSPSPLAKDGFRHWLRMTKLAGRELSAEQIDALSVAEQAKIGRNIGIALARVHANLRDALAAAGRGLSTLDMTIAYVELAQAAEQLGDPFYLDAIAEIAKACRRIPHAIMVHATHGDFNTSNILMTRGRTICGILDFAEWGAGFPEKDFAHVLQEAPALASHVIAAYERESGFTTDPWRLALGLAENALYGAVISARQNDADGVKSCRAVLSAELKRLPC